MRTRELCSRIMRRPGAMRSLAVPASLMARDLAAPGSPDPSQLRNVGGFRPRPAGTRHRRWVAGRTIGATCAIQSPSSVTALGIRRRANPTIPRFRLPPMRERRCPPGLRYGRETARQCDTHRRFQGRVDRAAICGIPRRHPHTRLFTNADQYIVAKIPMHPRVTGVRIGHSI